MKISDRDYLEAVLKSVKLELKEVEVQDRIFIAQSKIKKEMLQKQIDSIELQLRENN